ncbi:hypothetical protein EV361DRAFT_981250 [Lentinula raphanica]|nr:hypothetical protein EV361DRAFT_981250 [Lentinula raphanica]
MHRSYSLSCTLTPFLFVKGTGVVTSVPSDSPDDFQTLTDLRKKAEFYKIDPSWAAIDPVPVISTPTYGDLTAPAVHLAEAKEIAYKEGFYNGTMLVGEFKGMSVQDAKPKVRESMIQAGLAFAHVASMELYGPETRNAFAKTLACARTYGLGSDMPWDPQYLVESLSDSTIYMAYYTVSQLLHEDSIDGSRPGPLGISASQMTDEVWEYMFCDGPWPSPAPFPQEKADALKHEFNYFYPFDIHSSGKDLINNHLTFALYNHVAIFPQDKWSIGIRTNGHLMLNFGADSCRLALADAGDGIEDANFDEKNGSANILRVHTLLAWCEEIIKED